MSQQRQEHDSNSKRFQERRNLNITNANMFISNNNNPFLVSPYSFPTGNFAKKSDINTISNIISTFIGDVSTVINLEDFSLSISTITNIPSGSAVTVSTSQFVIDAPLTTIVGDLTISNILTTSSLNASNITTDFLTANSTIIASTLDATNIQFITLTGTTINATDIFFNTLDGSTIQASTISAPYINFTTIQGQLILVSSIETHNIQSNTIQTSTIIASTIDAHIGNFSTLQVSTLLASTIDAQIGNFSTLQVSTLLASTIDAHIGNFSTLQVSTLLASTIDAQIGNFSTIQASTILTSSISSLRLEVKELVFSSICMAPVYISTAVTTFHSSILICLGGQTWKIPIEAA